jgi:hypothetical protein
MTFFHGSRDRDEVRSVFTQGFRSEFTDEEGRWFRDGNLGIGTYLSCDWRTALWFGNTLIQATVTKGTRVLDTSIPPERRVLKYLSREFGREILEPRDPRTVIPRNKSLLQREFIALFRHHFQEAWHSKDTISEAGKAGRTLKHAEMVHVFSRRMFHYGFHGFGHPSSDNGILIVQSERIIPERVLLDVPREKHEALVEPDSCRRVSLSQLVKQFSPETLLQIDRLGRASR